MNHHVTRYASGVSRLLVVVTAAGLAAGCAADSYKATTDSFADSSKKAETALHAMWNTAIQQNLDAIFQRLSVSQDVRISAKRGTCAGGAKECVLELNEDGSKTPKLISLPSDRFLLGELMHGITQYAGNLQAIIASDAGNQAGEHMKAAAGSVKDLADTLKKADKLGAADTKQIDQLATPIGNLLAWVAGEYVNGVKVKALRDTTQAARSVVSQTADVLSGLAGVLDRADIKDIVEEKYRNARKAAEKNPTDHAAFNAFVSAADDYNVALHTHAADVFSALKEAHEKLARQLAGDEMSFAELGAAMQNFATKANALWKLIQAVDAENKPTKE